MDPIETTLFVCPLVYIYQIPPLRSTAGYKAADWDVETPLWQGRLRLVEVGSDPLGCEVRLEESSTGELFAAAPYASDGTGVRIVTDSSRFFAITVINGSMKAVLGLGFPDRNNSFEFNIALQDFKRHSVKEVKPTSHVDYSLKQGQKIHLSLPGAATTTEEAEEPSAAPALLAPPPSRRQVQKSFDDDFSDDFGDFQ